MNALQFVERALSILLKCYGSDLNSSRLSKYKSQAIYECAHDWVSQGNNDCDDFRLFQEQLLRRTMKILFNVLSLASFIMLPASILGGDYVISIEPALMDMAKEKATDMITEMVTDSVSGAIVEGAIPELPSVTGPALPLL